MPIIVTEDADSRETRAGNFESSQTRVYKIANTDEHNEAIAALEDPDNCPLEVDVRGDGQTILRIGVDIIHTGPGVWVGRADYSSLSPDTFSFDTGGGTEHIVVNDQGPTWRYARPGETAPDFQGLIGVDGDNIAGVDIPSGNLSAQYTRGLTLRGQLTGQYMETLIGMKNAVNTSWFYGLYPGEALFLGVSGYFNSGVWELLFRWASSYNRANFTVGDIQVEWKDGWDYLWALSEDDTDENATRLVKRPIAVYVERLLPSRDFTALGIGTTW